MSALTPQIGILVANTSGMDIPPRSIVVCTGVTIDFDSTPEGTTIHQVDQYTGQAGNIFVTGSTTILDGNLGLAYSDDLIYVAIDTSPYIPTPLVGEQWGPVANTWTVSRGGMGFFCQGYTDAGDSYKRAIFRRDRGWCRGKLTGTLSAGTASIPTTCQFDVWHPDPTSTAKPPPLIKASATGLQGLTASNWDASLTGSANYYCKVEPAEGWLEFYWVGCKAS